MNHSIEEESQKVQIIKIKALNTEGEIKLINIFKISDYRKYVMRIIKI